MTRTVRFPAMAGALAAAFCLATLAPAASKEAAAQVIWAPGNPQVYYNGFGAGYNNGYDNGYGRYGAVNYGYTVYGNGPYVYGSPAMFGNPTTGLFGYRNGASFSPDYRGLRYDGGAYRRVYTPNNARYYSPYGYSGF
jgi:hypothetical protein